MAGGQAQAVQALRAAEVAPHDHGLAVGGGNERLCFRAVDSPLPVAGEERRVVLFLPPEAAAEPFEGSAMRPDRPPTRRIAGDWDDLLPLIGRALRTDRFSLTPLEGELAFLLPEALQPVADRVKLESALAAFERVKTPLLVRSLDEASELFCNPSPPSAEPFLPFAVVPVFVRDRLRAVLSFEAPSEEVLYSRLEAATILCKAIGLFGELIDQPFAAAPDSVEYPPVR